jgi:hypothetical protein
MRLDKLIKEIAIEIKSARPDFSQETLISWTPGLKSLSEKQKIFALENLRGIDYPSVEKLLKAVFQQKIDELWLKTLEMIRQGVYPVDDLIIYSTSKEIGLIDQWRCVKSSSLPFLQRAFSEACMGYLTGGKEIKSFPQTEPPRAIASVPRSADTTVEDCKKFVQAIAEKVKADKVKRKNKK